MDIQTKEYYPTIQRNGVLTQATWGMSLHRVGEMMGTIPMHTLVIGTLSSTGAMVFSPASEPMDTEGLPAP